jgi:hypothetical protein
VGSARRDYFAVQDALELLDSGWGWQSPERAALTPAAWEHLRTYGSRLRTSLTLDIGTRSRPRMSAEREPFDRTLAGRYEREDGTTLTLVLPPRLLPRGRPQLLLTSPDGQQRWDIPILRWAPTRSSARVRMRTATDGDLLERVIWFESGQLVEGPPLYTQHPAPATLWHRTDPPAVAEVRPDR